MRKIMALSLLDYGSGQLGHGFGHGQGHGHGGSGSGRAGHGFERAFDEVGRRT
jgi:hypothetical protein